MGDFTVKEVLSESTKILITPNYGCLIDGRVPSHVGGYTSKLILEVKPDNTFIPIKTLYFDGISIVAAGDYISAKMPIYGSEIIFDEPLLSAHSSHKELYLSRDFNPKESAIELKLFSGHNKSLSRTDLAVDYSKYLEK